MNKPPLYVWLTAAAFRFGVGEFTARVVSALAGAALLPVTYAIARLYGGVVVAVGAALILLLGDEFVAAARFGTSDELLTLVVYLSILSVLLALRYDGRWWYAAGVTFGLAVMTKGFAAAVLAIGVLAALAIDHRLGVLRRREPWIALGIALGIALPWHAAVFAWQGSAFWDQYVGYMVANRASHAIEGHAEGPLYYLIQLRGQFYPWVYLLPFAYVAHLMRLRRESMSTLLAVFPAVVFLLYTLVASKLSWYLVPVYPALAILVADLLLNRGPHLRLVRYAAAAVALALAVFWVPHSVRATAWELLVAAIAAAAGVLLVAAVLARARIGPMWAAVTILPLAVVAIVAISPLYQLQQSPVVAIARSAAASQEDVSGGRCCLYLYIGNAERFSDDDVSHSLLFYSHRQVAIITTPQQLPASACAADVVYKTMYEPVFASRFKIRHLDTAPPWSYSQVAAGSGCT